jgi:hypothetical protein
MYKARPTKHPPIALTRATAKPKLSHCFSPDRPSGTSLQIPLIGAGFLFRCLASEPCARFEPASGNGLQFLGDLTRKFPAGRGVAEQILEGRQPLLAPSPAQDGHAVASSLSA